MPKKCPVCKQEMTIRKVNIATENGTIVTSYYHYCPVCGYVEPA